MSLRAIMLQREAEAARAALSSAEESLTAVRAREADLTQAVQDASTDEERAAVRAAVEQYETDIAAGEQLIRERRAALEAAEQQARDAMAKPDTPAPPEYAPENRQRGGASMPMITVEGCGTRSRAVRTVFGGLDAQQRAAIFQQQEVRDWLGNTRAIMRKEQRAITNVGLTIPDVMLDLLRANLEGYSKLYKHVRVRSVRGNARQLLSTVPPEAIWTDCCAALNELTMVFYQDEFDCHKVGGYYAVCNANLEDSDLDLAAEILQSLAESIGLALDKAILYGRNASSTLKMPMGIVSRLAQTEAPSGYPATARPWTDLHTTNIITIPATETGAALFAAIIRASGAAKARPYSTGGKAWAMNEATHTTLLAEAMSINSAGAIVSGMGNTMPVIGGAVELLDFMPNNVIVGGAMDLYTLVERAGKKFAASEHVRFLNDETVFKGTARYDGGPSIAEAFVAIGINGTTPTATMAFASDTANAGG